MIISNRFSLFKVASNQLLPAKQFSIGSSKDLDFPSVPHRNYGSPPKSQPSKADRLAKSLKLSKKRENRAVKALEYGAKQAETRLASMERQFETKNKLKVAEELAIGLEPFSDQDLDGMYRGLIEATPQELVRPVLAAPKSLLLKDPDQAVEGRDGRMLALAERLSSEEQINAQDGTIGDLGSRLMSRREIITEKSLLEVDNESSQSRRILSKLESLIDASEPMEVEQEGIEVPVGIVVRSEWRDLVLTCSKEDDTDAVMKVFELMKRSGVPSDGSLLNDVMESYALQKRARDCLELAQFASETGLTSSVVTHHHILSSLLPIHPTLALKHLHSLEEAGHTPLVETYNLIIDSLLAPTSPTHLVARGWDLYAHTRLVSHPIPSVELYNTMMRACSTGPHASPERAIDLFTEMTDDNKLPPNSSTYDAIIRACAREGSQEYYFEALRFMRQMLDVNINPTRFTFNAILEGAKAHGDLARARWVLVKMVEVGGEAAPDENTLGLIFQTYASYKPPLTQSSRKAFKSTVVEPTQGTRELPSTFISPPTTRPKLESTSESISNILEDSSLFYPGPLPQTRDEVMEEARNLMIQCVGLSALDSTAIPSIIESNQFSNVRPSIYLLNCYLSLLSSHAPSFQDQVDYFETIYDKLQIPKNRMSFETMLIKCETAKNRELSVEVGKKVFTEWLLISSREISREKEEGILMSGQGGFNFGRSISTMWTCMIRVLARNYHDQEAVRLLQSFIATYPPTALLEQSKSLRNDLRSLPPNPTPIKLSDPLYPETTTSSILNRPPYIKFEMIKLLHLRLANIEDTRSLAVVKGICKAYEGALRSCEEYESNRTRIIKSQVEVVRVMEEMDLEKGGARRKEGFRKRS